MNKAKSFFSHCLIISALVLIPAFVSAGPGKGWKKPYAPKNTSEAELFKACAYGNANSCYKYRELYILPQSGTPEGKEKKEAM